MCELFGFTADHKRDLRDYLTEFYSHSVHHPHGWGLAAYKDGKLNIVTEPICATRSKIIHEVIGSLEPQNHMIAHIRLATVGTLGKLNCHPFQKTDMTGRTWVMAHNGTVFSGMTLLKYDELQEGETDSERILMYFVDKINERTKEKGSPLTSAERCAVIDTAIAAITKRNKVNLILYDTQQFYVHTNMKGTLFRRAEDGAVMFATVPYEAAGWEELPLCTLLVYQNGNLIFTGNNHHNEYIESISLIENDMEFHL